MKWVFLAVGVGFFGSAAGAQTHVDGYNRRDGTYVAPHYRTTPDSSRLNNWGSQGNVNPYTGKSGTVNPYTPQTPSYGTTTTPNTFGTQRRGY